MADGGVDYSFECTGNGDVLREAFSSTHAVYGYLQPILFTPFIYGFLMGNVTFDRHKIF